MRRRHRPVLWVAGLLLAAPLGAQQVECDGRLPEVRRLAFDGNTAYRDDQLALRIVTTPSGMLRRLLRVVGQRWCYDSTVTKVADVVRLSYFYDERGFRGTKVEAEVTELRGNAVAVRYRITEGRPVVVESLTVNGLDGVPDGGRVVRSLPLRTGDRMDRERLGAMRDTLTRRLRNNGYPVAEVFQNIDTDTASLRARVWYDVVPGPRMRLGDIPVSVSKARGLRGGIGVDTARVRATLGINTGDVFSERNLEGVKRGLQLTDVYQHVDVSVDTASLSDGIDSLVTVRVDLVEQQLHAARGSVGWGTYDCARALGNLSVLNALGGLRRVDLTGRVSRLALCQQDVKRDFVSGGDTTINFYAGATYTQPALFERRVFPSFTLFSERRSEYTAYLKDTPIGANAALQIGGRIPVTLSYQLELGSTRATSAYYCSLSGVCDPETISFLQQDRRSAVVGLSAAKSTMNDVADPSSGSVMRAELRHASTGVGSDKFVEFTRGTVEAVRYLRLSGDGRLVLRARAGRIFTEQRLGDNQRFIPPQERLYAGGPTSVRGFLPNQMGSLVYHVGDSAFSEVRDGGNLYYRYNPARPRLRADQPTGGDNVIVLNAEARLRSPFYPELLQWAVFVDAGQVWNTRSEDLKTAIRGLKTTPGIGVRAFTPIGPVRIDIGLAPRSLPSGPMYFSDARATRNGVPNPDIGQVYCVSPGNQLPITVGSGGELAQASGVCPSTFQPTALKGLGRIRFNFAIGQAF
jgi:outer membrane protein insertion porin family